MIFHIKIFYTVTSYELVILVDSFYKAILALIIEPIN